MDVVAVDAVTCDTVVLRWRQRFATPVAGISVLKAVFNNDDWRVAAVGTEFNSLAYPRDFGRVDDGV
ncbi:hypothetical protein F5Y10DRAFT_252601 [Nemania abortiva]|nr:hypothetical protein F5Y10DRAFT_252601 [Nemania abortiva]